MLTKSSSSGLSRVHGACHPGQFPKYVLWHFPKHPCCLLGNRWLPILFGELTMEHNYF